MILTDNETYFKIQMKDSEPEQLREQLIKSLALVFKNLSQAMRMDIYTEDNKNVYVLAEVLETLSSTPDYALQSKNQTIVDEQSQLLTMVFNKPCNRKFRDEIIAAIAAANRWAATIMERGKMVASNYTLALLLEALVEQDLAVAG